MTYSFDFFPGSACPADDGRGECGGESLEGVCGENECEFVEDSCETVCDDSCEDVSGDSFESEPETNDALYELSGVV